MPHRDHRHGHDHHAARGWRAWRVHWHLVDAGLSSVARGTRGARSVLVPDSAHGTNPATAARLRLSRLQNMQVEFASVWWTSLALEKLVTEDDGRADAHQSLSTIGVFESEIHKIADILHAKGALLYMDGANMNALVGKDASRRLRRGCHALESCTRRFRLRMAAVDRVRVRWRARRFWSHFFQRRLWWKAQMACCGLTTTGRRLSGVCACFTATSGCSCGRWHTSSRTVRMAAADDGRRGAERELYSQEA